MGKKPNQVEDNCFVKWIICVWNCEFFSHATICCNLIEVTSLTAVWSLSNLWRLSLSFSWFLYVHLSMWANVLIIRLIICCCSRFNCLRYNFSHVLIAIHLCRRFLKKKVKRKKKKKREKQQWGTTSENEVMIVWRNTVNSSKLVSLSRNIVRDNNNNKKFILFVLLLLLLFMTEWGGEISHIEIKAK